MEIEIDEETLNKIDSISNSRAEFILKAIDEKIKSERMKKFLDFKGEKRDDDENFSPNFQGSWEN